MTLTETLSALDGRANLTADDALALRKVIFGQDVAVTPDEADALFKLNADAGSISPEWRDLFVEAMTDFVVRQQDPLGYVDDAKTDWLIAAVSHYRRVRADEVEMLLHVLEQANQTPRRLSDFVLGLLKTLTLWRLEHQGRLLGDDVERLRRLLFASGSEGNIAVTRHEAETLFDINDALGAATVDPAWSDLFVRAVGNAVLFESTWTPDAGAEAKREAWLKDTSIHPFARLASLANVTATREAMMDGFHQVIHRDYANHDLDQAFAADQAVEAGAERITADEAHWLIDRIGRGGGVDANEQALLAFLRANAQAIDPSLQALIDGVPASPAKAEAAPGRGAFGRRASPALSS